ncbi:MAG: hypothetical protein O3A02_00800 [bacterium]|nr:hypothetical protein [bacterium]
MAEKRVVHRRASVERFGGGRVAICTAIAAGIGAFVDARVCVFIDAFIGDGLLVPANLILDDGELDQHQLHRRVDQLAHRVRQALELDCGVAPAEDVVGGRLAFGAEVLREGVHQAARLELQPAATLPRGDDGRAAAPLRLDQLEHAGERDALHLAHADALDLFEHALGHVLVAGGLAQHPQAAVARQALIHAVRRHPREHYHG